MAMDNRQVNAEPLSKWRLLRKVGTYLTWAVYGVALAGCSQGAPPRWANSVPLPVRVHLVAGLEFDEHLTLQCEHGNATRLFDLHYDREVEESSEERQQLLLSSGMPGQTGFNLRLMYVSNAILEFSRSGRTSPGITITERNPGNPTTQACDDWFLGDAMKFDPDKLLWTNGNAVIDFGSGTKPSTQPQWQPLNRQTWSIWWNALNARYDIPQLFGDTPS
jgi:hypothetical protein